MKLKISFRGHKGQKEKAQNILATIIGLNEMAEGEARLRIQELIDTHHLKAAILINGNSVWSKKRILRNLNIILKHGTLYDQRRPKWIPIGSMLRIPNGGKPLLSRYFYQFLTLCCGSIAHYNIHGWITHYPTVEYLKKFFKRNEFGKPVRDWIPAWQTDARLIVEEIEAKLFPFQTYMKTRQ